MSQLRALLPLLGAQPVDGVLSPASTGPSSLSPAGSAEFVGKSPRTTRRAHRRMRPPLLPVSLDLSRVGLLSGLFPAVSAGVEVPSSEHDQSFGVGGGGL